MTITTLYDKDDVLWYMKNNKPVWGKVYSIATNHDGSSNTIRYFFSYGSNDYQHERYVFKSKEDLLNSL